MHLFDDCCSFEDSYQQDRRGCLLVDASILTTSSLGLIEHLKADDIPTIVVSSHATFPMAVQAIRAGVADFLEMPIGPEELLSSVRRVLELSSDANKLSSFRKAAAARVSRLTNRQHQILDLIVAGHPSKNIAADLHISQRTVENHRASISSKTGSKSFAGLVHTALCAGCSLNANSDRRA